MYSPLDTPAPSNLILRMPAPRVAVLLNPLSGRVRRRAAAVRARVCELAGPLYAEASEPAAMTDAVLGFSLGTDDVLCVVAGDGTLHAVLTAFERRPDVERPILAPAPGGTTNMTTRDLGRPGGLFRYLEALLCWKAAGGGADAPGRLVERPVLRIAAPGSDPLAGMFFGAGTVAAGVDFFNRRLRSMGIPAAVGSPVAVVRTMLAVAMGGRSLDHLAPPTTVCVERGPVLDGPAVFLVATTLHRLIFGARPYWANGLGPIHFTLVERGAVGMFRNVPRLAIGRASDRMTPERGWHSHGTSCVHVTLDGPFIVDGEIHHASRADGPLELSASRAARFWMP